MEGLRAPAIGKAFPKAATAVSGRAAVLASMAAASIGLSAGGVPPAALQPGAVQAPPAVARAAASAGQIARMEAAAAQGLLGNVAQKAPSLGRAGGSALAAAGSALAPTVERGLGAAGQASGLGAAARALAPIAGKLGSAFSPLAAVIPDLLFPAAANKGEDEALKKAQDADRAAARKGGDRVGDKFKNGQNPRLRDPGAGTEPGVAYLVNYTSKLEGQSAFSGSVVLPGPIGGVGSAASETFPDLKNVFISFGNGQKHGILSNASSGSNVSITAVNRLDGGENTPIADPIEPGGGLILPATNSNSPTLPTMPRSGSLPATASARPPGTGAPTPQDGVRNPANPSQPSPGDPTVPGASAPTPQTPLDPASPSTPGQGTQTPTPTLPGIPSAPDAGSASLTAPTFNPTFTPIPGVRSDQPFEPIQKPPTEPTKPPGCADPCMATIQNALPPIGSALEGLDELLAQLLAGQQQQQEQQEEQQNELTDISVPFCSCLPDGTGRIEQRPLRVPQALATATLELFTTLATVQELQCKTQRHAERAHNILGGDIWFKTSDSREAEYKVKLERKVKEFGTFFGFPAIPDEDPAAVLIEEEQARLSGIPIPGQIKVKNIVSLLNAYTSNLYHRAGFQGLPTSVPRSLLGYTDNETPATVSDMATYFVWFVQQVDALIGKFPINITIDDIDPLTEGNQTREIELPNISEALAEMYGLNISTSVNADVTVNFLMRLASELIATKNSTLITQDYVRANAAFLGYKGNPARREVNYSFTPAKLDSLDAFLQESKGYLVGWEEDDKESVVGFLQRIVFSSGIIKAAFFRDKKRLLELQKEIESMMKGDKVNSDAEWNALLALLNDETEYFNKDSIPFPRVREKPVPPPPEAPTV